MTKLPKELRSLVNQSVALLGEVIERELGDKGYRRIEELRVGMTEMREMKSNESVKKLQSHFRKLENCSKQEHHDTAHSFTLMLELINTCENAYRSHRLNIRNRPNFESGELPRAIIYVLTAHPTEARSPQNIAIFHEIQNLLEKILDRADTLEDSDQEIIPTHAESANLRHALEIAWRTPIVRNRKPKVKDEAEHIYSMLFRDEILTGLLQKDKNHPSFYVRSWVGGDKDGHPGVDEKAMLESLTLSRAKLIYLVKQELRSIRKTLDIFPSKSLHKDIFKIENSLRRLNKISTGDAILIQKFRTVIHNLKESYEREIGAVHPHLHNLLRIIHTFPGLVVPLELRESSDVLMSEKIGSRQKLAIFRMLQSLEKISRTGDPRWYARGFIISMTESIDHIRAAASFQKEVFGAIPISIIPLFEAAESLANAENIMTEFTNDLTLKKVAVKNWNSRVEMMVGYSDSAKEAGVLASRLAIASALPRLEKVCERQNLTPVFFHGSGGSIDRGGGSIEDQTAWWPRSALRLYKVTVQGEMIERSLATNNIAKRQIESIVESAAKGLRKKISIRKISAVDTLAKDISEIYSNSITSRKFLNLVELATPYPYLSALKIGSRPSKRSTSELTVKSLRAIPWVLCWTQTRVLFPTWWGVGTAWKNRSSQEKSELKLAFKNDPVFTSYIKALGFTLAKIEMPIWQMYLEESALTREEKNWAIQEFNNELSLTIKCYQEICNQKNLMWFRPWLGESITLRSSMIHPLNLLQIIAQKNKDLQLLRVTVTGISSGMLTTG